MCLIIVVFGGGISGSCLCLVSCRIWWCVGLMVVSIGCSLFLLVVMMFSFVVCVMFVVVVLIV